MEQVTLYYLNVINKGYMFRTHEEAKKARDYFEDGNIVKCDCYIINNIAIPIDKQYKIYTPKEAIMESLPQKLREVLD